MRRMTVGVLVAALLVTATPARAGWRPGVEKARRYADARSGSVSFAVIGPHGGKFTHAARTSVPAASTLKVMFMNAYLRHIRDRKINRSDKDLLAPMIKVSANEPATRIADMLGPGPMYRLANDAGMEGFSYTRPWGASTVTAIDQARYMFELERYLPNKHEDYALYLLKNVTGSQRWGIGRINRPKWRFYFKGGWGSGSGAVCHQIAFIERGGIRIAAAVMITNSPSHDYATETLRGVFKRLLVDLPKPK